MSEDDPANILDQSEIDRLLNETAEEQKPSVMLIRADGTRVNDESDIKPENYDFRNPAFLSELELRRLRILHEDFIRYLGARLSLFLRMEIGLKMAKLTTVAYSKFTETLPNPTHLCLFKTEPLVGVGILDINPRLALTIADRLLGGRGHSVKVERYLTEIEIALLEDVILMILEEWCNQWKAEQELQPIVIGHENNGRFLQTSPKDAVILALAIEVSFGDCSEQIQIGVPYYTIEPLVRAMQSRRQKDTTVSQTEKSSTWQPTYDNINLPVRAEWEAFDLNLREISCLRVGDLIELPAELIDQTRLLVNGTPLFQGTVGLDDQHIVVQLSERLNSNAPLLENPDGRKIT
jgi:flagellar motor switch protein FliM